MEVSRSRDIRDCAKMHGASSKNITGFVMGFLVSMSICRGSCESVFMGAGVALLAFILVINSSAASPPAMFSPWYAESLRDILDLDEADAARLEQQLAANADDSPTRLKLMAYYQRADRAAHLEDRAKRVQHALWLIEHHPVSELLHSPVSHFSEGGLSPAEYRKAVALWDGAAKTTAAVQWNAASFFQGLDAGLHLKYLEATATADPNHPFALRPLAHLYALAILEGGPLASRAQSGLEASKNVWVLGNAAYMLQSQYNQALQGERQTRAPLNWRSAISCAPKLDPKLERQAILPQLDLQAIARAREAEARNQQDWQARAKEAVGKIRRLPVEAFPNLPAAVSRVLRARKCTAPQHRRTALRAM